MGIKTSLSLKDIKNFSQHISKVSLEKLSSSLLNDINNELNMLKTLMPKTAHHQDKTTQLLDKIVSTKLSPKTLSKIQTLIKELVTLISKDNNYPKELKNTLSTLEQHINNFINKSKLRSAILDLKNEILSTKKDKTIPPQIKNIAKMLDNFASKITYNNDTKVLTQQFQEIAKKFESLKKETDALFTIKHLTKITQKIQNISELLDIKTTKEFKELDTLLKEILTKHKTKEIKLTDRQTLIKHIGNISKKLTHISKMLPKDDRFTPLKNGLTQFSNNIKEIDLKTNIKNSGIFYEAKLPEILQNGKFDEINSDVKAILLKVKQDDMLKNDKNLQNLIDKTLTNINTLQTNTLITQSFITYIPFSWENLKDGTISFSKLRQKDKFSCKIELDLEHYGKVDIMMLFFEKNISIKMHIDSTEFKESLKKDQNSLKKALNDIGYETNIFFDSVPKECYDLEQEYNLGMDLKI